MIHYRRVVAFSFLLIILLAASPPMSFPEEQIFNIEETDQFDIGTRLTSIAVDHKLNRIYIGSFEELFVMDGESKQVLTTVRLYNDSSIGIDWIVVDSLNNQIWVFGYDNILYLIDGETYSIRVAPSWDSKRRPHFAFDPQRNRYYVIYIATVMGFGDEIRVFNSTDLTLIRSIPIPGSADATYITEDFDIAVDTELDRVYAEWRGRCFIFDGISGTLINERGSKSFIESYSPTIHDNKIYARRGIFDAVTFDKITSFDFKLTFFYNLQDDIAYGFALANKNLKQGDPFIYSLQAEDTVTSELLASSNEIFHDEYHWSEATVNIQTGEIYLVDWRSESGSISVWTITSSPYTPPPELMDEEPTTEAPTDEEPTTEEPTSEEPTTEEPTDEEPTTEAPTDEEPTANGVSDSNFEIPFGVLIAVPIIAISCIVAFWIIRKRKQNKPKNSETRQKE